MSLCPMACACASCQAAGQMLLMMISEDPFRAVAKLGLSMKTLLVEFALKVCQHFIAIQDSSDDFRLLFECPAAVPLKHALEKVNSCSRCLLHFFCTEVPDNMVHTLDADVMKFTTYAGDDAFMRSMRRLFTEENSFWAQEASEIICKGASGILVAEKVSQLRSSLAELPSWSILRQAHKLLKEVRGNARSQQVGDVLQKFSESWHCSAGFRLRHSMGVRQGPFQRALLGFSLASVFP